jgi:glycosyltransferase involved in cell wall biosynthesis
MENPKVSVCILTYNQEAYIGQAVESALTQRTNFRTELIIGEDCSTDRTREIVVDLARKHPDKIRLRLAPQNQGGGRNFVDLFHQCRGEYVVILEGDDYWTSPDKLQSQVDVLDAHPQWSMCFHPATNVYDDGRPSHLFPEEQTKSEYTVYDLLVKDFMATSAVMFRNGLFGKLPDWFADVVVGDWALHILNADHGNVGFLPEPMSVYRIHEGGVFSKKSLEFKLVTIFKMLTKIDHHLGGKYTREIDENRLHTVRWLVGQWEHEVQISKQTVAQATQLATKLAELEASKTYLKPHNERSEVLSGSEANSERLRLAVERLTAHSAELEFKLSRNEVTTEAATAHAAQLEAECAKLRTDMESLKSFHDDWHKSPLYRVYRETLRPWRQLRSRWLSGVRAHPRRSVGS